MNLPSLFLYVILLCLGLGLSSCKSTYEKIRTSNDAPLMLKAANDYYKKKDWVRAQALYELALSSYRGQKEADDLYYNYADCHYQLSEYEMAAHLFKNYSITFPNNPRKEEAEFLAAYAIYKTSPGFRLDQSGTAKAIEALQAFVNTYPESKKVGECNQLIDNLRLKLETKALEQGRLYLDTKHYQAGITTLENLLTDFPETKEDREIRYLIAKASFELAENSIFEKQKERYLQAVEKAELFQKRYTGGKYAQEIKKIKEDAKSKAKNQKYDRYQSTSIGNKS
ncbi:MAG TPA: outer membrane protein assembly factor BamD [Saprospiraceae bacterium]|nr:outer membrane protein assembly factor BamD [Saprospiraceae bacterium]